MSEEERQAIIHLLDKQARYEHCIKNNISFSDEDYEAYIIRQSMINKDKEIERLNNIINELEKWLKYKKEQMEEFELYKRKETGAFWYSTMGNIETFIERIQEKKNKYLIDTNIINRKLLEKIGIPKENIIESQICTVCNSNQMHSYRIDKENAGRNTAIIGLKS